MNREFGVLSLLSNPFKVAANFGANLGSNFRERLIVKVEFDEFIRLANEAFDKVGLDFGIVTNFFCSEYRDHPKMKALDERIKKGK